MADHPPARDKRCHNCAFTCRPLDDKRLKAAPTAGLSRRPVINFLLPANYDRGELLIGGRPRFKVLEVVGGRLRRLVGIIEELSFTTVRQRLAAYLLKKGETEGRPMDRGLTFFWMAAIRRSRPRSAQCGNWCRVI